MYKWKTATASITLGKKDYPRIYGLVNRNGRIYFRKYKNVLKNGKGLDQLDILNYRIEQIKQDILRDLYSLPWVNEKALEVRKLLHESNL
jgi:hypothetical protein